MVCGASCERQSTNGDRDGGGKVILPSHRKPWNILVRVFAGVTAGSGLVASNVPARLVKRDESSGSGFSPPFFAWMTMPILQPMVGCQASNMGAFDPNLGYEVWNNDGITYIGTNLWSETWLPLDPAIYRRVYLFDHNPGHGPGGGGPPPGPPLPGPNCPAAGAYPLGTLVTSVINPGVTDWWTMPVTAGLPYTITMNQIVPGVGATVVDYGTCAAPINLGGTIFYPWMFAWAQPATSNLLVSVNGNLMAACQYTMLITSP